MQKTLPKIKFGKKELTPILTDEGKTVTISWRKGTETTEEQRKIIYEAGFKYDGNAKAIKAPYNAEVKTALEKLSGAKIDVEPKTEVQTLREIFASNGIDTSKPVELPTAPKVNLADMLDKLKNADDVNANGETDKSTTDVGKPLCTIRLNGVKGEVRSLPDGRVSLKMEKRVKFTKEEKQAYRKAGFAWKSKEEGSIAENTPALDEFLKKYLVQDASDNNANSNTATQTKSEKPKQADNTNKNEAGKADKLPTIQVGGKELNPILRKKDNMVWIAPPDKLPLDVRKSLGQAGFHWDSGGFYYAPYGQPKVRDFLEKHQKDNIGGSKGTPGLDAASASIKDFFASNSIDTSKPVELPTVPKVSLADMLDKLKNANNGNKNKGENSGKKEGSDADKAEGKSEPIKKEPSADKKNDSNEGNSPVKQQADTETKPDVSGIVKGLNTDDNGLYLMNKKTPVDNIELIQKYNEASLLERVKGICNKWRNGEISIDEASKEVNALKRIYTRSARQVPTVSKDCIEKIEETRKQMFIDRDADAREQHRKQLDADKKAREEAEAPRKEFYQKALKDAKDAAENVTKQHKEGKMFLEEALDSLEKIKGELEKKLETNKDSSGKGDFLRVDDRKAVYDKQVAAVKKEQEKIDKKILESATTDAMADGSEVLSKEGREVYDWVKSSLSNDSKKRFSTNAVEAAAQLLAFRAQTWSKLFNKYLGTNYTPLAFAQRYKFAFFDDKIDNRTSSTAGLTTQILTADEAAKGRLAFSEKASTTTLFHEMAHMFFSDFALVAESPLAPQKLKDDFKRLREWIGRGTDKTSKEYTQTPYFNSEQRSKSDGGPVDEERFAQAVVKHIADADTPMPWLNKLFTDLKAEIQSYIEKFMLKIQKALGKESSKSKKWANAYTFDFEIPADVKRIINEVVFSGKDEVSKPFAERIKELDDLRSQADIMLNGDSHVGAAEIRDFQMKLANASKGGNEYTDEQNASLAAARNSIWLEFDEKRAKHDASVALAEVKNGNTDTNIVAKAASGLIEGKPDELETLPKEALNILDSVLSEQEKEDVADIGRESIAAAVTADYAFDGKLSDDFDALVKGLKDDELSYETIDAVKKYADTMLRALQKYQDLYDKHEAVEEAVKVAKEANDALIVKNKASHVADAPMMENAGDSNKRKDEVKFSARQSKLGKALYQAAWHGSPHIIEGNLTTAKIGTGEGAAVHGWGLYFAKDRGIAQERYRDRLLKTRPSGTIKLTDKKTGKSATFKYNWPDEVYYIDGDIETEYMFSTAMTLAEYGGNKDLALKETQRRIKGLEALLGDEEYLSQEEAFVEDDREQLAELKAVVHFIETAELPSTPTGEGSLLKVEIPENDVLLDEDKTFEEQTQKVKDALMAIAKEAKPFAYTDSSEYISALQGAIELNANGRELYRATATTAFVTEKGFEGGSDESSKYGSLALNKHGIKGIHYWGETDGECFVIFDDNAIAIQERYDAAIRKHQNELLRSRNEILEKCKKLFGTDDIQVNNNGTFTITTKGGSKFTLDIQNKILINDAEAKRARKEHGIADGAEMTIEGYYRPMYSSDVDGVVSVSLDSRENTEAHEATHAAIALALSKKEKDILFDRAKKIADEYGLKSNEEEIAADAVRNFVSAREHGYITDFTKSETEKLQKTAWGRMMLRANRVGRKAALFTKLHEAELQKTAWGRMILAKNKLQRLVAKLMRKVYDFVKKAQAMFEKVDNFHDLARRIELGEVWGEKARERNSDGDKYQAKKSKLDEALQKKINEDSDRFAAMVDEWSKNPKKWFEEHKFETVDFMRQTPLALALTGAKQYPLKISSGFLGHSTKTKHPGMTPAVIKQIPKAMVEPLMILKDFEDVKGVKKEFPNKRVLVLGVKNEYGATVVVPVKLEVDVERKRTVVNMPQTAFGVGGAKPSYQYFINALENNGELLYLDSKKSLAWAKAAKDARTDTLTGLIRKRASDESILHKQDLVNARQTNPGKYSARSKPRSQDLGIAGINEAYKNKLEEAYAAGAGDNRITAIMNEHQKELAEYLKDKGEKQKERTKLRAAEIRSLRKKLHAKEIESFSLAGAVVRLDKDGKEVVEKIDDGLPNRTYVNKRHEGEEPANVAQKLGSRIAREEPKTRTQKVKEWILNAKSQFYKHFVDKYDALHLLDDAIAKASGKKIDGANTVLGRMNMAANSASGMAMALLEGNADELKQAANKYGIKNMVSLQMLMEKIGTDMKAGRFADYVKSTNPQGKAELEERISAIENYLVARSLLESAQNHRLDYDRSVAEWEKKGSHGDKPIFEPYKFPGGMTEQEIRQVIKEAPVGFKEYAKMFKGITDNMLDILYNTGLITGDRYLATKSRYKAYCPLMRDFSDTAAVDSFIDQINSGKGLANVSDPLKNRSSEGSERDIVPPLRTIVTSINALTQKAERNRVGQYAVKQASKYKLDDYIKEVKGKSSDAKNCIFTVMFNGEKHSYQTIPEMYPAITAAVEPLVKIEMALLTKPAQWLRTGSTMSPSFILRNLIRDTLFAGIASKNGFIPIYDSIRGMNALLNNQQLRSEFNASGVISSNFYGDGESVMRSLESMAGGKKWQELGLLDIVKGIFHKPIEGLEWISNLAEAGTRMGEFMRAREKGKSVDQAAYDAVEITLNFGRSGATGQQINRMVPFFNACIQGGDKLYRMYKADPRRTLLRIGTYIVLPSVVLWLWNHDEDWYKELDPNVKMTNWILPNGIRIPKPQEAGILFGSGAEAMLDTANGQDPKAMANWCGQVRDALTPGIIPTLALPLFEWITNYSFFRGKPIVSKSQERLPDELQYGPYTSEMSKALGDNPIVKLSPVKIDNLWRGYTGTMGMFLWQAPDLLIAEKRNLPEKKLSEMAFVRDFVVNDMNLTRTMNDFYQLKEASAKWQAGYGKKGKPTAAVSGVNTAANTISKLQKEIRDITTNPKYTPAQKRMLVDKNRAKQQKVAQLCLKKYGDKFDI